ncbi:MAG: PTS sugar transporter subunit IIA [Symbiobacterium sp.]|uniref:PTS sugar transporter subunit IIA domain-containing protein n=1 Tax=Symbiobacterium sp. TaxID=1971213 RepID=UPI00346415FA
MIGCIITGHGGFGPGLAQALSMIAGPQPHLHVIPFRETESLETFEGRLRDALAELLRETGGVLIFTDLMGGTPFRTAMLAASQYENVEVLTGTNLPMLIEIGLLRAAESDVRALAEQAVAIGTSSVEHVRLQQERRPEPPAGSEEGI